MQHHVHVMLFRQAHHLVEGFPAVVFAFRIALVVSNMAVCGDEDPNGICTYILLAHLSPVLKLHIPRCRPRARGGMLGALIV